MKKRLLVFAHLKGAEHRVRDNVLVAQVSRQSKHRKLMSTGPDRGLLPTTSKRTCTQRSTWLQPNCATSTWRGCGLTPMTSSRSPASALVNQGEYHIRGISAIKRVARGDEFIVKVDREGLEEAESIWEPVSRVFHDAPAVLRKELKAMRLKAEQKRALVQRYRLRL